MLFNSYEFIFFFLPLTLIVFFQIGRQGYHRAAIFWLVVASFFFYAWWEVSYLILLLGSILFNYCIGVALSRRYTTNLINPKYLLALGVVVNLGLIGYFKYANFFVISTNGLFGTNFNFHNIILPLAISFFTFNQIAYLVDAYQGNAKEYNFLKYCLFITFFPHLIAGPIVHHQEMIPQFEKKSIYDFNPEDMAVGLTMFSLGLFKKVVIADSSAYYANPVFNAASQAMSLTCFEAWSGVLTYSLQLYFDFSGYSDMAIGAARMFGIKFPLNFNSPYKAVNIIDFWRRWHMTLSRFLRDYLYIPLGGNRKGKLRRYLNIIITMLIGGLWHGAGWTFVLWGGLHGIYLVINHEWHSFRRALGHDLSKSRWWSQGLGCLATFIAVTVAWVFFRAENMNAVITMVKGMIGVNSISTLSSSSVPAIGIKMLVLLFVITWFTPNTQQWMGLYNPAIEVVKYPSGYRYCLWKRLQWQPTIAFGMIIGVITFISVKSFLAAPTSEFLYFNF